MAAEVGLRGFSLAAWQQVVGQNLIVERPSIRSSQPKLRWLEIRSFFWGAKTFRSSWLAKMASRNNRAPAVLKLIGIRKAVSFVKLEIIGKV
jgi:hypothetical protein